MGTDTAGARTRAESGCIFELARTIALERGGRSGWRKAWRGSEPLSGAKSDAGARAKLFETHLGNVRQLLQRSNHELRIRYQDAASTVVTLLIHGGRAACLWSGDSRCYLLRGDVLYQCTCDHTLRQGKIARNELTVHEAARMVSGNVVTSAVGAKDDLRLETTCFSLCPGDRFLLCSDGLSNCMSPKVLSAFLAGSRARDAALGISDALQRSGHCDDATVVTVFLSGR